MEGEGEVGKERKSEGDGKWRERGGMSTGWKKTRSEEKYGSVNMPSTDWNTLALVFFSLGHKEG